MPNISDYGLSIERLSKKDILPGSGAISDPKWQEVRKSMKGVSTTQKLATCRSWLRANNSSPQSKIQVMNYLNALKRGGQLDDNNNVAR